MVKAANTDIDIDLQDRSKALEGLDYIPASLERSDEFVPHNTGIYFQEIPFDPESGLASIGAKEAEERGYFKIDFLNVSLYDGIKDENHLNELINKEPEWDLLKYKEFVEELWHIHNHYKLVRKMLPKSIDQLAMLLSIIRPCKAHLQGKSWDEVEKDVWRKPNPGDQGYEFKESFFKKSHSYAYALGIVVQMNLIVEQLSNEDREENNR